MRCPSVVMQQYLGRPKKDLNWPVRGFQPRTLIRLIFAVSLNFLVAIDYLSNVLFYTDWHKLWKPVNHIFLRQASTANLEPGKSTGATQKTTATKSIHYSERSVKTASRLPIPSLRGWAICMECTLAVKWSPTDLRPGATMLAGSWRSPCWLPIIVGSA